MCTGTKKIDPALNFVKLLFYRFIRSQICIHQDTSIFRVKHKLNIHAVILIFHTVTYQIFPAIQFYQLSICLLLLDHYRKRPYLSLILHSITACAWNDSRIKNLVK